MFLSLFFSPAKGHVNGARYEILDITGKIIHARLATGPHKGNEIYIPRISFQPKQKELMFEMERRQFPVRACFAITANKSQGQTFKKIGVYLAE